MRISAVILLISLLSCGPLVDAFPEIEGQDQAERIVYEVFVEAGYKEPPPTAILWFRDQCLPEPWALGTADCDPAAHDCRCMTGRAIYLVWGCVAAVRWRDGGAISDTSFAHELGWHCANLDVWHSLPLRPVVREANDRLREAGL